MSACPAYLFREAESSFRVSVPFSALCCALKSETLEPCLGCFAVFLLANRKKKKKITHRTKQRNKAWHLIFSYLKSIPVETRLLVLFMKRQLLAAPSFRGQHACFVNKLISCALVYVISLLYIFFCFFVLQTATKFKSMTCAYTTRFSKV